MSLEDIPAHININRFQKHFKGGAYRVSGQAYFSSNPWEENFTEVAGEEPKKSSRTTTYLVLRGASKELNGRGSGRFINRLR